MKYLLQFLKYALLLPVIAFSILFAIIHLPYLWYPSFDDIDIDRVIEEADILHSLCEGVSSEDGSKLTYVDVKSDEIPYIRSLTAEESHNGKYGIRCGEGIYISMWDDWWVTEAGLYVVSKDKQLPSYLKPFATKLTGRVYRWHNPG